MDVAQQSHRQFRDPGADALWVAIQDNQRELAEAKLSTAQSFGVLTAQLATLQATVNGMAKLLENKQDRDEDKTYRAWQQDRYSQISPQAQQASKYSRNIDIQTLCIIMALVFSALAAFGVHL